MSQDSPTASNSSSDKIGIIAVIATVVISVLAVAILVTSRTCFR